MTPTQIYGLLFSMLVALSTFFDVVLWLVTKLPAMFRRSA